MALDLAHVYLFGSHPEASPLIESLPEAMVARAGLVPSDVMNVAYAQGVEANGKSVRRPEIYRPAHDLVR